MYDKCRDIKTFNQNTVKGIGKGDILADINFRGKTKIRLTIVMHIPSVDGKILSLKVLDQRGFESHIARGQICIMKGMEVYAEVSLGGEELYEVKMKIIPAQETRANEGRREKTQSKVGGADSTRPSGCISVRMLVHSTMQSGAEREFRHWLQLMHCT